MGTKTPKLGLEKSTESEIVDINELNDNFDRLDAQAGTRVVTSTTRPAVPWVGQIIFETDTKKIMLWAGSGWIYVGGGAYAMAAGIAVITTAASPSGSVTATFPVGRFSVIPIVTVSRSSGSGAKMIPYTTNVRAEDVLVGLYSGDSTVVTGTFSVHWIAVQMTPTSAAG